MSFISFQCYACNKRLKVGADKAGKRAKCIHCQTMLTIPVASAPSPPGPTSVTANTPMPRQPLQPGSAAPPVPPPTSAPRVAPPRSPEAIPTRHNVELVEEPPLPVGKWVPDSEVTSPVADEAPRPRRRDEARSQWPFARLGLLLALIGTGVMAAAFALQTLGYLLLSIVWAQLLTGTLPTSNNSSETILGIAAILAVVATLVCIAGYVLCLLGPHKKNALMFSVATLSTAVVGVLLKLLVEVPAHFRVQGPFSMASNDSFFVPWFLFLLVQLSYGAEIVLFPLVPRAFSLALKKKKNARRAFLPLLLAGAYTAERLLTFIFLYVLVNTVTSGLSGGGSRPSEGTFKALGWVSLILLWIGIFVYAAFLVWNALYLWKTRRLIPAGNEEG